MDQNYRFRDFLKHRTRLSSEEVDNLVFGIEKKVPPESPRSTSCR
jgi:hypothetical protein